MLFLVACTGNNNQLVSQSELVPENTPVDGNQIKAPEETLSSDSMYSDYNGKNIKFRFPKTWEMTEYQADYEYFIRFNLPTKNKNRAPNQVTIVISDMAEKSKNFDYQNKNIFEQYIENDNTMDISNITVDGCNGYKAVSIESETLYISFEKGDLRYDLIFMSDEGEFLELLPEVESMISSISTY